ncbi:hypothetical protein PTT_11764 [Pyrenophora teres f. teres 0-1]|uniref:Uncharacterized protein n=1 Tax=Pyrenophora teres f. teres (strain 0-1) TaxID=861557 RepID=E3RSB1_PYRTT|nr:hypothetical protein PTT_11764 [Pyrenophora teres f. teres 0-1]
MSTNPTTETATEVIKKPSTTRCIATFRPTDVFSKAFTKLTIQLSRAKAIEINRACLTILPLTLKKLTSINPHTLAETSFSGSHITIRRRLSKTPYTTPLNSHTETTEIFSEAPYGSSCVALSVAASRTANDQVIHIRPTTTTESIKTASMELKPSREGTWKIIKARPAICSWWTSGSIASIVGVV